MADRRFEVEDTGLDGLRVVTRKPIGDARGFLARLFCQTELGEAGFSAPVAQINQTMTRAAGSIRGMHFQRPPFAEDKLVTVIRGEIMDVAVDLRAGSPTYLRWHAERLSAENGRSLLIPKGFAHGFQTLVPDCELIYLHSCDYHPEAEGGLNPLDPRLGIDWPLPLAEMSPRDRAHPMISSDFAGLSL